MLKELRTLNFSLNAIETIRWRRRRGGGGGENEGKEQRDDKGDVDEHDDEEQEGPLASLESLARLDLSGNFISVATAAETALSLSSAPALESLWMTGCPVAVGWERGYRPFFVASLPRLKELVR